MPDITATDASRSFRAVLDAVAEQRATFTVFRHGEPVALVVPPGPRSLSSDEFLARLRQAPPVDADFADDLDAIRDTQPEADVMSWD